MIYKSDNYFIRQVIGCSLFLLKIVSPIITIDIPMSCVVCSLYAKTAVKCTIILFQQLMELVHTIELNHTAVAISPVITSHQ